MKTEQPEPTITSDITDADKIKYLEIMLARNQITKRTEALVELKRLKEKT